MSIGAATGAGNASLGYPVTKLVRLVQRGPRHVGLSPLKMVQLKPHCSDAAALERDTRQALHRKPEANSLSVLCIYWRSQNSVQCCFSPVVKNSPLINVFGVRLPCRSILDPSQCVWEKLPAEQTFSVAPGRNAGREIPAAERCHQ